MSTPQELDQADVVDALFQEHCARCHGALGDGQGVTELDRPARSFRQGGFSYGNTPRAIFRTITHGIPGTPMPSFEETLDETERRSLAAHVISLGPERSAITLSDTVMVVEDQARVVRGFLPPISEAGIEHPRGLLIGLPSGLTFEYRVDDVRLLGLRQGDFVERRDWIGRGGASLTPLGTVVHLIEGGNPRSTWFGEAEVQPPPMNTTGERRGDLHAKLEGTWTHGTGAGLSYRLVSDGSAQFRIREELSALGTSLGSGYSRDFELALADPDHSTRVTHRVAFRLGFLDEGDQVLTTLLQPAKATGVGGAIWVVIQRAQGSYDIVHLSGAGELSIESHGAKRSSLCSWVTPEQNPRLRMDTLILSQYEPDNLNKLIEEMDR